MSDLEISLPNSLAIIPARGGSKGLPRKNVRALGGIPLIAHTIRAATHSCIERVIVTTDDDEISDIARQYGAEVPFKRPPQFSGDKATSLSVLIHAVEYMENTEDMSIDHVVYLQPTSPFRNTEHINDAVKRYIANGKTSLISVTDVSEFHPYFMFTKDDDGVLEPLHKIDPRPLRRQDLPPIYRINGATYISKRDYFRNIPPEAAIFDWNSLSSHVMDTSSSIDINDYLDFKQAEWLIEHLEGFS